MQANPTSIEAASGVVKTGISLERDLFRRVSAAAEKSMRSRSNWIAWALERELEREECGQVGQRSDPEAK